MSSHLFKSAVYAVTTLSFMYVSTVFAMGSAESQDAAANPPVAASVMNSHSQINKDLQRQNFVSAKTCYERSLHVEVLTTRYKACMAHGDQGRCAKINDAAQVIQSSTPAPLNCSASAAVAGVAFQKAVDVSSKDGDVDAQMCYTSGAFHAPSEVDVEEYKARASAYLEKALMRGDWRGVELLTTSPETIAHGGAGMLGSLTIIGKPFTRYRAYRLLELGATDSYKKTLADSTKELSQQLTPGQITNANVWAAQHYTNYFSSSAKLAADPLGCLSTP